MKIQVGTICGSNIFKPGLQCEAPAEIDGGKPEYKGLLGSTSFEVEYINHDGTTEKFGRFTLAPLPGCCGVVVSIDSYICPYKRGQYYPSRWFHELKAKVAKHFGYSMMLMTTQLRNIPEVVGSTRSGWKIVKTFKNTRTTNELGIGLKEI